MNIMFTLVNVKVFNESALSFRISVQCDIDFELFNKEVRFLGYCQLLSLTDNVSVSVFGLSTKTISKESQSTHNIHSSLCCVVLWYGVQVLNEVGVGVFQRKDQLTANSEPNYLNVQQAHWLQNQQRPIRLCCVINNVIACRLHANDKSFCTIYSFITELSISVALYFYSAQ